MQIPNVILRKCSEIKKQGRIEDPLEHLWRNVFVKIVNGWKPLTIFASITDVRGQALSQVKKWAILSLKLFVLHNLKPFYLNFISSINLNFIPVCNKNVFGKSLSNEYIDEGYKYPAFLKQPFADFLQNRCS